MIMRGHKAVLLRVAICAGLVLVGSCKDETMVQTNLTGIKLTIVYATTLNLDQVQVSGSLSDGSEAFRPATVPESPKALTAGQNTLVVLLPDALGGSTITVFVNGVSQGTKVATDEAQVSVVARQIVPVTLTLRDLRRPLGVSLSAGGGVASSPGYEARVIVGAPQPLGRAGGVNLGFDPSR